MKHVITYLRHNAIATVALFVALGGTSYAAVAIPKDSVGSRQLRKGAVTSSKLKGGSVTPGKLAGSSFGGRILYLAEISNNGGVQLSDPKGIKTENWSLTSNGGEVIYPRPIPKSCFPLVSGAADETGPGETIPVAGASLNNSNSIVVATNGDTFVTLAVVCGR